jgi:hypothetical protein
MSLLFSLAWLIVVLPACILGVPAVSPTPEVTPTLAQPTPNLLPMALPTQVQIATATPLPLPTEIVPMTSTLDPALGTQGAAPSTAGISISPALGEPGDTVVVNGSGFPPQVKVTFHWVAVNAPAGPAYYEMETDGNGSFNVGLIVPPADKWPGGAPKEMDILQLQTRSTALGDYFYYANFTYVKRFSPEISLVLTYASPTYGYSVSALNGWSWDDQDAANVRFTAPSGLGKGFVRTLVMSDVGAAIQSVMAAEAAGQGFTTEDSVLNGYTGTKATADNGLIVWFIPANGRIYALSFTDSAGNYFPAAANSFKLQ